MTALVGKTVTLKFGIEDSFVPDVNDGFILDMDEAMKAKVSGIHVRDDRAGTRRRRVPAYFRNPDSDVTDQTFPYITVELLRYERAGYREQRSGDLAIPYVPEWYNSSPPSDLARLHTDEAPIPYDFFWQVSSFARSIDHDRQIQFALMQNDRLSTRFGYLQVGETIHYLDLMNGPENQDSIQGGKRLFRKTWMVRASAEFFQTPIDELVLASSLDLTVDIKD